jgi:hypothetical protein
MSSTTSSRGVPVRSAQDDMQLYAGEERGIGWLFFAGSMLGLAGLMRIIDSIWAFTYKGALPDNLKNGVLGEDLKNYAWVWLIVGALLLISSFLVMTRSQFARWVGLFAAAIGAISAITWMPYYPVWSFLYIGIATMVIYALAMYGGRDLT